ncbi:uncharacterized protein LOC135498025 [Lineus longissimus]|uniref:uncharacterized protein LOC135498025 n=1 Tax=Lineus longissimus TaxID=88925 RepID=UPI002B4E9FE8
MYLRWKGQMILQRLFTDSSLMIVLNKARCLTTQQQRVCRVMLTTPKQQKLAPVCGFPSGISEYLFVDDGVISRRRIVTPIRCYSKGIMGDATLTDTSSMYSSAGGNELATQDEPGPKKPLDFIDSLHAQLRHSDVNATLNLVTQFDSQMVTEHVFHSIVKIYYHLRNLPSVDRDDAITDLKCDERFQLLCVMAAKKGRFNTPRQVLRTINTLALMKYKSDNKIMQVFLELAKHHVNFYHCAEIVHLGFLLSKFEETEQVCILKQQLTLALKLVLYKEIQFLSSTQLCNLLTAFGESLGEDQMLRVLGALLIQKDSSKFKSYETLLKLLAKLRQRDIMLIRVCLNKIRHLVKVDKFSDESLLIVLNSLVDLHYYCQLTFTDLAHHISNKELGAAEICAYLNAFLACRNCPKNIMEKFICGLENEFESLEIANIGELNWFLRPLVLSNWKDGRLGHVLTTMKKRADELVERIDSSIQKGSLAGYSELLVNLLVVGYRVEDLPIRSDLLDKSIQQVHRITDITKRIKVLHDVGLVCLAHKTATGIDLACTSCLKDTLDTVIDKKNTLVQPILSRILGGDMFTVEKVFESGILLAHVFVLDKDKGSMTVTELVENVEHREKSAILKSSTGSQQRYAICILRTKHVLKNLRCLTGPIQLQLDLMKQLGYYTVVIVPHVWNAVPERERLDLLQFKLEVAKEDGVACII